VNYAYALSHGFTPVTIIPDKPIKFEVGGQAPYIPHNYDNKFRGDITLRSALAESRNIPAVRVLNSYGVDKMIELGRQMGITTWKDPSQYGLSLTLGGGETRLLDLANVYSTIANYGSRPDVTTILKVSDFRGNVLETADEQNHEVLDPRVAYSLIDILKDNNARSPAFGSHSALVVSKHPEVAVKTGTSNDLKDNLTVGFNQKYLTAVWVGNNDGSPMRSIASGITGAAPIWNEIMNRLLAKEQSVAWKVPDGMIQVASCGGTEWFLQEMKPKINCPSPKPNFALFEDQR
jgi:membrane carboxypeptidase/penicillin-binding protein PbpC